MFLLLSCYFVFLLFYLDSVSVAAGKVQIMYDSLTNSTFHFFLSNAVREWIVTNRVGECQ